MHLLFKVPGAVRRLHLLFHCQIINQHSMKIYEKLLLENKAWAAEKVIEDPDFLSQA